MGSVWPRHCAWCLPAHDAALACPSPHCPDNYIKGCLGAKEGAKCNLLQHFRIFLHSLFVDVCRRMQLTRSIDGGFSYVASCPTQAGSAKRKRPKSSDGYSGAVCHARLATQLQAQAHIGARKSGIDVDGVEAAKCRCCLSDSVVRCPGAVVVDGRGGVLDAVVEELPSLIYDEEQVAV